MSQHGKWSQMSVSVETENDMTAYVINAVCYKSASVILKKVPKCIVLILILFLFYKIKAKITCSLYNSYNWDILK